MLGVASQTAKDAATISLARRGHARVSRKADSSVVTDVDFAIQEMILAAICETFPDHAVLAEETIEHADRHADPASAQFCWVVDPLDGTRNYASGIPCFSTSIAVLDRGVPIVGVVHEHNTADSYTATAGGGTLLNGQAVKTLEAAPGQDVLIGIPSGKDELTRAVVNHWTAEPNIVMRNLGSTAVQLAMVAAGILHAGFGKRTKIWDEAAGYVLITEAGGTMTDPFGEALSPYDMQADPQRDIPFLAAAKRTHTDLICSIKEAMAKRIDSD